MKKLFIKSISSLFIKFLADLLDDAINASAADAELEADLEAKKIPKSKR